MKSCDIVFPVYLKNHEILEESVTKVVTYCASFCSEYQWMITISINGRSPEKMIQLSKKICERFRNVRYLYTSTPGKGSGLKNAWMNASADYLVYMDVDLSTDLSALPNLLSQLNYSDMVVGSRYHADSIVSRSFIRRIISITYQKVIHRVFLKTKYDDAHCGFKGIRKEAAQLLIPSIKDPGWYFDSELMFLAEKFGFKITSIPVKWVESRIPSGVHFVNVIPSFILKSLQLKLRRFPHIGGGTFPRQKKEKSSEN